MTLTLFTVTNPVTSYYPGTSKEITNPRLYKDKTSITKNLNARHQFMVPLNKVTSQHESSLPPNQELQAAYHT
jgi:hypothetical protein